MHPGRVATVLCWWRRTFQDITTSVHAISGHIQFGTCPIRNIITSGSVIYRDKHDSGLHNCTISSYYVQTVRTESRSKRQFGSN